MGIRGSKREREGPGDVGLLPINYLATTTWTQIVTNGAETRPFPTVGGLGAQWNTGRREG